MAPYYAIALLLVLAATSNASLDIRAVLNHPYAGSPLSTHDMHREAARASKARRAWDITRVAAMASGCGGGGISDDADMLVNPIGMEGHTVTIGIGTPPQPHTLIVDTGSDLTWTQCKLFDGTTPQSEPLYDPTKSSTFAVVPCDDELCQQGRFRTKNCSDNRCLYTYAYGSGNTNGVLASDAFTFSTHQKVPVSFSFGCGRLSSGSIDYTSGLLGLSPEKLSFMSQLNIPRFSCCLTPFTDRKSGHIFFGAMADLSRYKNTGPIQTTALLSNTIGRNYYFVPLTGISVGTKLLNVPASSFAIGPDGKGGTFVDTGYTTGALPSIALEALEEALVEALKLSLWNSSDPDWDFCFELPSGVSMEEVSAPPLTYHFDGGATMVLRRDSYLVQASDREMCLVIGDSSSWKGAIIGNYQLQNMHVLFDLRNSKFSFAPTQCDQI